MKFLFSLLLVLFLGVKSKSFAQEKNVFIVGYFLNNSVDLTGFGKSHLSLSHLEFEVNYKLQLACLDSAFGKIESVSTDNFGCFEINAPYSILNANAVIRFKNPHFKNVYLNFKPENLSYPLYLTIIRSKIKSLCDCSCGLGGWLRNYTLYLGLNRGYNSEDIQRRGGLDNALKDIH